MKTFTIDFKQRLKLADVLGSMRGTLAELDSYDRAYVQIRISEDDGKSIGLISDPIPTGGTSWSWNPAADLSVLTKPITLEDQDAARVKMALPNFPGWTREDREWLHGLIASL